MAQGLKRASQAAARTRWGGTLTEAEAEFVEGMSGATGWAQFDPDYRQKDIARLFRLGLFERQGDGAARTYRWTEAGRHALKDA